MKTITKTIALLTLIAASVFGQQVVEPKAKALTDAEWNAKYLAPTPSQPTPLIDAALKNKQKTDALAQQSLDVRLQQRVAALEKEVQRLNAELVALRTQIQQSGSTPTASGNESTARSTTRPSVPEILACVDATPVQTGGTYAGWFTGGQYELGTMITSQGGLGQPSKGTNIFPVRRRRANDNFNWDFWAFTDSFGKLTCVRVN